MFKGVTVGEVMNTSPVTVPANISLQKLVHDLLLPRGWRSAWVMQIDQLVGLITLSDIRHILRDEWGQTPGCHAMIPVERLHVVSPRQSLNEALPLMVARDVNQLPVVEDGRLVGGLSREDVMRFLEIRRGLVLDAGGK
jgi:CBS domain-containing protein